jgi:hypothetical protein
MPGKISRIAVTYTVDTPDGPLHTFHGLPHMREHIQPARLQPLLDELTGICQELIASRLARPGNGLALARRTDTAPELRELMQDGAAPHGLRGSG